MWTSQACTVPQHPHLGSYLGGSGGHYELEMISLPSGIGGSAMSFIINGLSSFVTQAEVKSKANSLQEKLTLQADGSASTVTTVFIYFP